MNIWYILQWTLHEMRNRHFRRCARHLSIIWHLVRCHIRYQTWRLSVLHAVYALPPAKVAKFFTRDERNWHQYLQRQDAFTPDAVIRFQARQRETLKILLNDS